MPPKNIYRSRKVVSCKYCFYEKNDECQLRVCPYVAERITAKVINYEKLILEFFKGNQPRLFSTRLRKHCRTYRHFSYLSTSHRKLFEQTRDEIARITYTPVCGADLAILYLSTSDELMSKHIIPLITHAKQLSWRFESNGSLNAKKYAIFKTAKQFTKGDFEINPQEFLSSEFVPDSTFSLIINALLLANYGDVLQQKTFTQDCISKKKVRNTGQLPMYLVTNNHQGIIDRQTFDAVQVEMARRGACKSPSRKNAPTGLSAYKSRYALSERLVCGECGTLYRRCTWSKRGKKKVVWRCVSRLDYGTKYCHKSPTLEEGSLQRTILAAISSVMSQKETIISRITGAMEQTLAPIPGETMSLSEIEQRLAEIDEEVRRVVAQTAEQGLSICADYMKALTDECAELKKQRSRIQEQRTNNSALMKRVDDVASTLRQTSPTITEWDESLIRQLVDTVKVVSAEKIIVYLQGGTQVEQNMVE